MESFLAIWRSVPTLLSVQWLVLGYIIAFAFGNICFKKAGDQNGFGWVGFFILGNAVCFISTFFETWALANRNPNVIYAACLGGGFCALQLTSYFVFRFPLSMFQWVGVALVGLGIFCLQFKT